MCKTGYIIRLGVSLVGWWSMDTCVWVKGDLKDYRSRS